MVYCIIDTVVSKTWTTIFMKCDSTDILHFAKKLKTCLLKDILKYCQLNSWDGVKYSFVDFYSRRCDSSKPIDRLISIHFDNRFIVSLWKQKWWMFSGSSFSNVKFCYVSYDSQIFVKKQLEVSHLKYFKDQTISWLIKMNINLFIIMKIRISSSLCETTPEKVQYKKMGLHQVWSGFY